jgi:hypothetical protein
MVLPPPKMVKAPIVYKNSLYIFQNATLWLETFKYTCHNKSFFLFFGCEILHTCEKKKWKKNKNRSYSPCEKKVIKFQKKIKIILQHLLLILVLQQVFKCLNRFLELVAI